MLKGTNSTDLETRLSLNDVLSGSSNLTLQDVLSGNPMFSSKFEQFRKFLSKVERSLENLEFQLWYTNYEKRFFTVHGGGPPGFVPLKPPPVVNLLSLESRSSEGYDLFLEIPMHLHKLMAGETKWTKSLFSLKKNKPKLEFSCPNSHPFNEEIDMAVRLFLDPVSSLELNVPGKMRDQCLKKLVLSTHPDSLRPIYLHINQLLQGSWSSFLNRSKR